MSKLLLIIPTLDRSGAEKQFCLLAVGLLRRGMDLEVVALTRGGSMQAELSAAQIPLTILRKKNRFDLGALRRLRKLILNRKADVILSGLFAGNAASRLATLGLGARTPRIIISERCVDSWKSGWQLRLDKWLRSRTDLLVGNSESVASFYRDQGFPDEKIQVVPNGVTQPPLPTLSKDEFCTAIGLPQDAQLIAYVGRLAPQKRLKDLLWAIQMLRFSQPNAYLLLIGDGPQRDELEFFARDTEAATNVRFLGHREDAGSLLHLMDAFWLGSEFEGMSNSLMEAMACGKPVVVSDIPANRELVEHGVDGWVANLGDPAGFTQYTQRLLDDPALAQQMGEAGAQKMLEKFSVDAMVQRYWDLLHPSSSLAKP